MKDKNNELIIRRRKKIIRRRLFIFSLLMIAVSIALAFNLKTFDIKEISVINNEKVSKDDIISLSGIRTGENIFYVSFYKAEKNLLSNSYMETVKLKRKLPNIITITVKERKEVFYYKKDKDFYILNEKGVFLRKVNSAPKLLEIKGLDNKVSLDKDSLSFKDSRYKDTLEEFTILNNTNMSSYKFKSLDLGNLFNIKLYINSMEIRLGNSDDLLNKINTAINILDKEDISNENGYIDVSFKGNPVFSIKN